MQKEGRGRGEEREGRGMIKVCCDE